MLLSDSRLQCDLYENRNGSNAGIDTRFPLFPYGLQDGIEVTIWMCDQVVVSGTSAGGLAVYLNIDQINAKIQQAASTVSDGDYATVSGSDSVRVRGLASAGYFLDMGLPGGYHDQMLHLAQISNSTSALAPSCLMQAAREDRPRESCFFAEHAAPHITTPTFALQSRFDTWQLEHIPHISTKNVTGVEACACHATALSFASFLSLSASS